MTRLMRTRGRRAETLRNQHRGVAGSHSFQINLYLNTKEERTMFKNPKLEYRRWTFWARMMDRHPRLYKWCNKHLPIDTLPF